VLKTQDLDYSIFLFFKQNISVLQQSRPDIYLIPGTQHLYQYSGSLATYNQVEGFSPLMMKVQAMNCSIILNLTSYFEGLLENLLLRRIGKCGSVQGHVRQIVEDYRLELTRISSLSEFKKHFKKLFGKKISEIVGDTHDELTFVEKFYVVRHVLAHGSRIPTTILDLQGGGSKIEHEDRSYRELMHYLENKYKMSWDFHCDILTLLKFSTIIDDFSHATFSVAQNLVSALVEEGLISSETFWGDFTGTQAYYGKMDRVFEEPTREK
jgi:hypothetical protein